jgi:ABC-type transport system involved in cytochrome c biogenesis permease subunit
MTKSIERGDMMTADESDETRIATADRFERERRVAVTLMTVFFLFAAFFWVLVANTIGSYVRDGSEGVPIDFSGWSVIGFGMAVLFTVLLALGVWVMIALGMYERIAELPYTRTGADKAPPAGMPRIDYRP